MNEMYTVVAGYKKEADMRKVVIPDGVIGLERDCFRNCVPMEEVYIPDSVNFMDGNAFFGCTALRSVRLSPELTEIPFWGFRYCSSLKEIEMTGKVHRIGFCAFFGSGLERVVLPEGLETIQVSAFSLCHSLAHIELPSTLKEIEDSAFESSRSLSSIKLPDGLRSLGERTFWHSGLTGIDIPRRLSVLKKRTFRECEQLMSVYVPDNISSFEGEVFMGCKSLESVRLPVKLDLDDTAFDGCTSLKTLTVGKITADVSRAAPDVNVGKLVRFVLYTVRNRRFDIGSGIDSGIKPIYLTDLAFQLAEQGIAGAGAYAEQDINKALGYMAELDRPAAFDRLADMGAEISAEQTEHYIQLSIEKERREMYLSLIAYKRERFGFEDSEDTVNRFEL